jgi:hypothetical protein
MRCIRANPLHRSFNVVVNIRMEGYGASNVRQLRNVM